MGTVKGQGSKSSQCRNTNNEDSTPDVIPVARSREQARKTYDLLSHWYDFMAESSERRLRQLGIDLLDPLEGENMLEIGYGTGRSVEKLAEAVGPTGAVYGLDLSPKMKMIASRRMERSGLAARVTLEVGDAAEQLPYESHSFDGIFMNFSLELFEVPEMQSVLEECQRVLKPGGRLVTVSMYSPDRGKTGLMSRLYLWGHRSFPRFIDCRPIPAERLLRQFGWTLENTKNASTFNLPVIIVRAMT